MEGDGQGKLGHPIQREDLDLTREPREARHHGHEAPQLPHDKSESRDPVNLMQAMGFSPTKHMTPLQFLLAVVNDDIHAIFKNEKRLKRIEGRGGIAINYRIEAAKTAAKYLHMEQPKLSVQKNEDAKFGDELSSNIAKANERVQRRTTIIETIERISPDVPLAAASYPPVFDQVPKDLEYNDESGFYEEEDDE